MRVESIAQRIHALGYAESELVCQPIRIVVTRCTEGKKVELSRNGSIKVSWHRHTSKCTMSYMITSWHGSAVCIIGHLWGESTSKAFSLTSYGASILWFETAFCIVDTLSPTYPSDVRNLILLQVVQSEYQLAGDRYSRMIFTNEYQHCTNLRTLLQSTKMTSRCQWRPNVWLTTSNGVLVIGEAISFAALVTKTSLSTVRRTFFYISHKIFIQFAQDYDCPWSSPEEYG